MKINKNFKFIVLIFSTLNILQCLKISNEKNETGNKKYLSMDVNLSSEYIPGKSSVVIKELFSKIKKLNQVESELYKQCEDLVFTSKNDDAMKNFWDNVKAAKMATTPKK